MSESTPAERAPRPRAAKHGPVPTRLHRSVHLRGALIPLIVGLLIGPIFASVYLAAFHDPKAHLLPLGVVGDSRAVTAVHEQSRHLGDAFQVTHYATLASAQRAVLNHAVYGAWEVSPSKAELIVAGANGPAVTGTFEAALTPVAAASHLQLVVRDVRPLPEGDSRGLSVFYAVFGVVLGAFLFGLSIMGVGRQLPHGWRTASTLAFAMLTSVVVAWLIGPAFEALPAPFLLTAGTIAMLGLAIATTTMALLRLFGATGTFIASILLLTLGNATSTGILPRQYLPAWLEPLTDLLPVGVAVRALRGAAYFSGDGVVVAFVVLGVWVLAAVAVFGIVHELQNRRNVAPAQLPKRDTPVVQTQS